MKILPLLIFLLVSCTTNKKLVNSSEIKRKINVRAVYFDVDKLGNVYLIDEKGNLQVFDQNGKKKFDYADRRLGKISYIDVSNPLNLLIFFKDQGVIKMLDNTLSELRSINLYESGKFNSISAVCLSNDNNLWIHDAQYQKIWKVSETMKVLVETNPFNDLGQPSFLPNKMIERGNYLAVSSLKDGFMIFDNFGQFLKPIKIENVHDFQFDGSYLFVNEGAIRKESVNFPNTFTEEFPTGINPKEVKQAITLNGKVYFRYNDGIDWLP